MRDRVLEERRGLMMEGGREWLAGGLEIRLGAN